MSELRLQGARLPDSHNQHKLQFTTGQQWCVVLLINCCAVVLDDKMSCKQLSRSMLLIIQFQLNKFHATLYLLLFLSLYALKLYFWTVILYSQQGRSDTQSSCTLGLLQHSSEKTTRIFLCFLLESSILYILKH